MTKIARMKTLDNADELVDILKDRDLLIFEDVQGSKIYVKYDGNQFIIKPKSLKMDPLNFVDLVVQKYYNQAYTFFHTLPDYITALINPNWWFCFEYFPDNQPASVEYNRLPKNNLILSCIYKNGKYYYDYSELMEYSKLFDVEPLPVVFKGKLNDKQLEVIELYLNTAESDLKYIFDEDNFAYFFYKILNPRIENSFLMNPNEYNSNLEKMILKIEGKWDYSFEILNPLYKKMELVNNTEHVEIYSLILLKFLEYCQLIDLDKYKLNKITRDDIYIEFICQVFNSYMVNNKKNIINWDFTVPSFFKEDKFKINVDLLTNEETKEHIGSSPKVEYVFKCILSSFSRKRKKPLGVFNETTLELFNAFVNTIDKIIDRNLKINMEYALQKQDLKNFKDYFKLKYEVDAGKDMYPDLYTQFDGGEEKKGKGAKKKKGIEPIKGKETGEEPPFEPKKEVL